MAEVDSTQDLPVVSLVWRVLTETRLARVLTEASGIDNTAEKTSAHAWAQKKGEEFKCQIENKNMAI